MPRAQRAVQCNVRCTASFLWHGTRLGGVGEAGVVVHSAPHPACCLDHSTAFCYQRVLPAAPPMPKTTPPRAPVVGKVRVGGAVAAAARTPQSDSVKTQGRGRGPSSLLVSILVNVARDDVDAASPRSQKYKNGFLLPTPLALLVTDAWPTLVSVARRRACAHLVLSRTQQDASSWAARIKSRWPPAKSQDTSRAHVSSPLLIILDNQPQRRPAWHATTRNLRPLRRRAASARGRPRSSPRAARSRRMQPSPARAD
jgi:hypothetical protein